MKASLLDKKELNTGPF